MNQKLAFHFLLVLSFAFISPALGSEPGEGQLLRNEKIDGYQGIWYFNEKLDNEYVYKYSGGLGTYCAKHQPFAIYSPEANKTFFCYGGTNEQGNTLLHMVSCYDHASGMVPKPTLLLDKQTTDAHDNPVISIDTSGYIWIFSSSHGTSRPSYISKSKKPYNINQFELVDTTNFSYTQPWFVKDSGFIFFHTKYGFIESCDRTLCFITSPDGKSWSEPRALAAIERGHYQVSVASSDKAGTAFNKHPRPDGLNWRQNLYYMETPDFGSIWQTAGGQNLTIPVTDPGGKSLVFDSGELNVYLKDMDFDSDGYPVILFITSRGFESGPENDPRTWTTARWDGNKWIILKAMRSDNNYDMGSLYLEENRWVIIAPTGTGPQPYNPGGEVQFWESRDQGETWRKNRNMTSESERNHTYVRRPLQAHPDFYAFWADGHGRKPSESFFYFANDKGDVFKLPRKMKDDFEKPVRVFE